jgi:hypothetical protein
VKNEELLTQSEVFKDEIRAGPKPTDQAAEEMPKHHNHPLILRV